MAESKGTFHLIAEHFAGALAPLENAFASYNAFRNLLLRMGWKVTSLPASYTAIATDVGNLLTTLDGLAESPEIDEVLDLLSTISSLYTDIQNLSDAPGGVDPADFRADFPAKLFDFLLLNYLEDKLPQIYNLLQMFGVAELSYVDADGDRPSFSTVSLDWDKLPDLISNPAGELKSVLNWGEAELNFPVFAQYLVGLTGALGLQVQLGVVDMGTRSAYQEVSGGIAPNGEVTLSLPLVNVLVGDEIEEVGIEMMALPEGDDDAGIIIQPVLPTEIDAEIEISDSASLSLRADIDLDEQFGIIVRPSGITVKYPFDDGLSMPNAGFGGTFCYEPDEAVILLGNAGESRLQMTGAKISLDVDYVDGDIDIIASAELLGLELILSGGEADGFFRKVIGENDVTVEIPLGIRWSKNGGISFSGGNGFEVAVYPMLDIGPVTVESVEIQMEPESSPKGISLGLGAALSGELGPVAFSVQGIGIELMTLFQTGNAGPFDIELGFKAPTGIGLSIDAQGFVGGGFLYLDAEKGEYSGGIELAFYDLLTLSAVGIITTNNPDGSDGFSLLISISTQFTPIQLGFGFTLNGVGGLLGYNRSMDLDALRDGVKTGANDSILFPTDVVANVNRIISDMNEIFPIEDGQFVFGPMAKLGWGTPTLITVDLGLLIEVPDPVTVAILGVVKAVLPDEDANILRIQVNFLGAIDFEAGLISFDATLYDSKLLTFSLSGDMAFRLSYGSDPNFLLSVGGFHPKYTPPPMSLPNMDRLTIKLLSGNNPRLTIETYFAVTSNTVQFGAKAEVYAEAWKIYVLGYVSFDALFQFSPFFFSLALSAMVEVGMGKSVLFSVSLSMDLEGPTPWKVDGTASFKVLGVKVNVDFKVTWGEKKDTALPDIPVLPELVAELENPANWMAELPGHSQLSVTLNEIEPEAGTIIAHPAGVLKVSQKAVPLDMTIELYGNQKPSDATKFFIDEVSTDSGVMTTTKLQDYFAPAQYESMNDSKKLSRNSFEKMNSGVEMAASSTLAAEDFVYRPVEYERIIIDEENNRIPFSKWAMSDGIFNALIKGSAVAQMPYSYEKTRKSALAPESISVGQEGFTVASVDNLTAFDEVSSFGSEAESVAYMNELLAADPSLADSIQVIPNYELITP